MTTLESYIYRNIYLLRLSPLLNELKKFITEKQSNAKHYTQYYNFRKQH